MRVLSADQQAALRKPGHRVATFLRMDHPDGEVRVWTGTGVIDHGGDDWLGCGQIAAINGVGSSSEPSVSAVTMTLSGVPADALSVAETDLKGRQAVIYHGILTPADRVIDDLLVADVVDMDRQETSVADDGTYTVVVHGQSGFWQLERPSNLLWSAEEQKKIYPDDTGFDALATLEDLEVMWTRL